MDATLDKQLQQQAESRVGRTLLNKWHLDALLGIGGTASVYAATHRNGIRCAVKVLHDDFSVDPQAYRRFLREGTIANQVDHPGVVQILDDDVTDEGDAFLVMELLEGESLSDLAAASGGVLDVERVLLLAHQLLDVLATSHERGVLHRDIKPENVFLTRDGRVKILDFGIARFADLTAGLRATQAGMPMGTPAFMAPEQARGRWDLVGAQSDVWAVGATLFTLLSGRTVHRGDTVPELLAAAVSTPARSLATVAPDLPADVVAIVDRALALRLSDRWEDARAMRTAVAAAYERLTGRPPPEPPPPGERPPVFRNPDTRRPPALPAGNARDRETLAVRTLAKLKLAQRPRLVAGLAIGALTAVALLSAMQHPATGATASTTPTRVSERPPSAAPREPGPPAQAPPSRDARPAPAATPAAPAHPAAGAPRSTHMKELYDRRL